MKAKGFTLIEVLLAMVLLSVVMYIGSLSFSIFSERWRKDLGSFNTHVSDAKKLLLLRQLLHGAANYIVRDTNNNAVYLFYGDEQQLVFITNQPIFQTAAQALVRLTVKTLPSGEQQLLYAESSFLKQPLFRDAPLPQPDKTMVLLQSKHVRFNYYGWRSFADRSQFMEDSEGQLEWSATYNAASIGMLPYAVNLTWAQNEPIIYALKNDNRFKMIYVNDDI
ncbi:prepilin-type N-terminal cleavage/methylation domain-containing protein [Rheinheimera metallidurans]|uniref:prepilin-type N-terminal cleavage/methylation domain-containing protein n=1 Tax=Rheinheimera metallidurans TaxID=2925781 RepID=UPI00300152D9